MTNKIGIVSRDKQRHGFATKLPFYAYNTSGLFVERGCRGLLHSARFLSGANTLKAYPFTPLNPCKPPKTPSGTVTIRFEAPTEDNPSLTSASNPLSYSFIPPSTILSLSLFSPRFLSISISLSPQRSSVNRQFSLSNSAYSQGVDQTLSATNMYHTIFLLAEPASRTIGSRCVYSILFSLSLSLVCSLYPLSHLSFGDPSFLSFNPRETVAV